MANVFDEMGIYWAEIADKNQTEKQIQFLKTRLKPEGYILDLACGTGRHSIPLNQLMDIKWWDWMYRGNFSELPKQRSKSVEVVLGDMRFLPFKTGTFTAAISMDTSFGYLPSQQLMIGLA